MRRLLLLSILLLAWPRAAKLHAQTFSGVGVGIAVPAGSLGQINNPGFQLAGVWQSITPLKSVGFRVDGSYVVMQRKATIRNVSDRIASVTAGPVIRFPRIAVTYGYAVATGGVYNHSTSPRAVGSASSTDLGISLGGGVRFAIAGRRAFAEARYHRIMSSGGPRFVPITFGLVF